MERGGPKRRRSAFTLVELLVVIGIIALLIALFMPALSRAKEQANRVYCAGNLHNLGAACQHFASEHKGLFPMSYRLPDDAFPYRMPTVISRDPALDDDNGKWKTYGTTWDAFGKSGAKGNMWRCPSADYEVKILDISNGAPPEWGPIVWTSYLYVGGLSTSNVGKSTARWASTLNTTPGVRSNEKDSTNKVLAADLVYWSGGSGFKWDQIHGRSQINHRRKGDSLRPDFQNILYADGHVDGKGASYYSVALTTSNCSLQHAPSPMGGFLYWGGTQPPPPPTPNPNPTPTPAPTPAPAAPAAPPPPPPVLPNPLP